jgi:hypothetical protein
VADLLDPDALGFDALAGECAAELGTPLADVATIGECVLAQHECEAERLFEVQEPRAGEMLDLVRGLGARFDAPACLTDHGAASGAGDLKTAKAVDKCAAQIKTAGTKFLIAKLRGLERCVDAVFTCVVAKPGDAACATKANATCTKELAKIAVEAEKVGPSIDNKCAAAIIPFAVLSDPTGANLQALAATCADYAVPALDTLPAFKTCIVRQHSCRAEELVRFEAPRAEELLGVLSPPAALHSPFCPAPVE